MRQSKGFKKSLKQLKNFQGYSCSLAKTFFAVAMSVCAVSAKAQTQTMNLRDMTQEQRNALEEQKLGRPLTQGEREVKVAMDKFDYQPLVSMPIKIKKTAWTESDEVEFGKFVAAIGQGVAEKKCATATSCMRNPKLNKYAPLDPPTLELYTDCADLPYFLRAYFAYHNGLPFSYVSSIDINSVAYANADDKQSILAKSKTSNSPYGNRILKRGYSNVPKAPGKDVDFLRYTSTLINTTSTATNRVGPMTPGVEQSDIFPVKLDRRGVRPGSIVAATGHAMIVWNVNDKGEIRIIDGHPGSFIQEHLLAKSKIQMSRPDQGIGYYQFRPLKLQGATQHTDGTYYGGQIVPASNEELINAGLYSLEQFFGPGSKLKYGDKVEATAWKKAFPNSSAFNYLANNLHSKDVKIDAVSDIKNKLNLLCSDIQNRMKNYEDSQAAGIPQSEHPQELIQDIYGAEDATWEKFSTPGGDSRLRASVKDVVYDMVTNYRQAKSGKSYFIFTGNAQDYVAALKKVVGEVNVSCAVYYTNSVGAKVALSLSEVTKRLNRLSFDPFMCIEKTWGASGSEMSTCKDKDAGDRWYEAQKYMRNVIGKNDDDGNSNIRSDRKITLAMLQDTSLIDQVGTSAVNLGYSKKPVMDIEAILSSSEMLKQLGK